MRAGSVVLCVALMTSAGMASAQDAAMPEESRQRFDLGQQAFERGDYAVALSEWERVYALMEGHPRRAYLLYNMARAHEELGRSADALRLYERFLAEAAEDAPNRAEAQRRATELRLRVRLDEAPAPAPSERWSPSPIGIAIGSVGAAALIAGAAVGAVALVDGDAAVAGCEGTRCTPQAHAAIGDAQVLANAADGLLWGGLAVLATGVVLTFVLAESPTTASAACTNEGCVGVVRGVF